MSDTPAPADRARFVGIFIIAFVGIAYQVLLTRIFSVTLYYHFAFAGISLAMLGMTIGAEKVYLKVKRFTPERFEEEWTKAALGFGISAVLLTIYFLCVPLILPSMLIMTVLAFSMLLFIIPFTYSGICVTLVLTQSSPPGKLYAADLVGAALGCLGIVLLLFFLDPVTILFLLGALCAYAAWRMARGKNAALASKSLRVMYVLLLCALVQGGLYVSQAKHLGLFWAKGEEQNSVLFERWNTFSRVRVIPWKEKTPFGWGFGQPQTQPIEQKYIDIDADAGTIITRFDGDLKKLSFLAADIINSAYQVRPVQSVAIIGVGGGRDVMSALYFGAKEIIAIELNPAIVEALTHTFADFSGHFTQLPQVTFINAEARSWLAQHRPQVDLLQISLIDTWAATAAGGLALTENRLYTLEAWKEFLDTLTPRGILSVSRWYMPDAYRGEFYRLLSLAAEALEAQGIPPAEIQRHIVALYVNQIVTVMISKSAFSPDEVAHLYAMAKAKGFTVVIAPDSAPDKVSRMIISGQATKAFYDSLPIDIEASTDNRPFFFFTKRFKNAFVMQSLNVHEVTSNSALFALVILLFGTILVTAGFVIEPLARVSGRIPFRDVFSDLGYFACIGLGFMLIEISQMQRLMVFLGHPVFGLSVVLFTLLLFGGIGSATVHPDARPERLWGRMLGLCLVLSVTGLMTHFMAEQFVSFGTVWRIVVSIALLAPAGFFMGMMFPAGMILSARHRELQPWFWGINGSVSVFASILGMVISMRYGIAAAYWTGVGAYIVCLLIAIKNRRRFAG